MSTCDEAASTVLYAGSTCKEERTQGKQKTDAAEAVNSASKPIRLGLCFQVTFASYPRRHGRP